MQLKSGDIVRIVNKELDFPYQFGTVMHTTSHIWLHLLPGDIVWGIVNERGSDGEFHTHTHGGYEVRKVNKKDRAELFEWQLRNLDLGN